jgi:coenzyme F420-0:L-glutamate ligase/coenzyme F420-1:gamma-L-glutamate ligase
LHQYTPAEVSIRSLTNFPMVEDGDDLATLIATAIRENDVDLVNGDVLVIAQKIVSKAEGRLVRLDDIVAGTEAQALAARVDKDPRVVQLILDESVAVVRSVPGVLITEARVGLVMANAGIDMSNIVHSDVDDHVLLLPKDPDESARGLRVRLEQAFGVELGVIVNDSVGRAWRECTMGLAIGVSGIPARLDLRGERDLFGRELHVSETAVADSIATAASLVMGEASEGRPVAVVSGFQLPRTEQSARALLRAPDKDLFR